MRHPRKIYPESYYRDMAARETVQRIKFEQIVWDVTLLLTTNESDRNEIRSFVKSIEVNKGWATYYRSKNEEKNAILCDETVRRFEEELNKRLSSHDALQKMEMAQ